MIDRYIDIKSNLELSYKIIIMLKVPFFLMFVYFTQKMYIYKKLINHPLSSVGECESMWEKTTHKRSQIIKDEKLSTKRVRGERPLQKRTENKSIN